MTLDLRAALPLLLPRAIAWAEAQNAWIAQIGQGLDARQLAVAKRVGVLRPELIRVAMVSCLPQPEDSELRELALATGLFGTSMVGMTFGYGVYVCHGYVTFSLLSHEFRHVQQYEQAGSIAAYLPAYLEQVVTVGYDNAPFEIDARAHERPDR